MAGDRVGCHGGRIIVMVPYRGLNLVTYRLYIARWKACCFLQLCGELFGRRVPLQIDDQSNQIRKR